LQKKASRSLESIFRVIRDGEDAASVRAAIMDLGYETHKDIYPLLVKHLDDPNPGIQHAAVLSLGRLGRPEAIKELVKPKIFRSPASNIRWAAVSAVGRLGDYRVIDHLLKAVEDPEWIVRTQAVTELKSKVQDIIGLKDVRLARILIHMLSLENDEIVELAIDGFQEIGMESLHHLHEALNNSSATIRANAARALGKLKACQSTPFLLAALQDDDWQVRASAAEALGAVGDNACLEALVQKIQDNVEKVQEAAANAIVNFGNQATAPLLNALARERDKFAQRAFIKCLGKIGDPKCVPALIAYLRSSYFLVRQAAVSTLMRFGPSIAPLLLPVLSFNRSDIEQMKRDASDRRHPELQIRAIKALGGLEDHRAVPVLKGLVEDCPTDVQEAALRSLFQIGCAAWGRCCAVRILAEVGDSAMLPQILASLTDDSDNVRLEAVRTFGKLGGSDAVKHLLRAAKKDRADFVRAEAIRVLRSAGTVHPGIFEAGMRGLRDKSREVRAQAARLLGIIHDDRSINPLLKAMADPHWSVRESAENALLNYGQNALRPLIEALDSPSWTTRVRAARLLGEIGDVRGVAPLKKLLARKRERQRVRDVTESSLRKILAKNTI